MSVQINHAMLHAVSLAASTEAARYYLNGVLVEASNSSVLYVATDGHMLIAVRDEVETDPHSPIIVPTEFCRLKYPNKYQSYVSLTPDTGGSFLLDNRVKFSPVDGSFPDWRFAISSAFTCSGETAQFNPDLLATIRKAAKRLGFDGYPHVAHNGGGPALVTWGMPDQFAIVMPVRSESGIKLPSWALPSRSAVERSPEREKTAAA